MMLLISFILFAALCVAWMIAPSEPKIASMPAPSPLPAAVGAD